MSTQDSDPRKVLVVGGTGQLGRMIIAELQTFPGVEVRALVRPESRNKAMESLSADVEIVEGDLSSSEDVLREACRGVTSVVSAVQGGEDVIVDGQLALLRAAVAEGVCRFVPSDFTFDFRKLEEGANPNADLRRAFAERSVDEAGEAQVVHIYNGCFLDMENLFGFLGAFDIAHGTMALWGDGHAVMDFTARRDAARVAAWAAVTDHKVPDHFQVAGDSLDFWGLKQAVEEGSGRIFDVVEHGGLELLEERIAVLQEARPDDLMAWLPLIFWHDMLTGRPKLTNLKTSMVPDFEPESVRSYVERHADEFGLGSQKPPG